MIKKMNTGNKLAVLFAILTIIYNVVIYYRYEAFNNAANYPWSMWCGVLIFVAWAIPVEEPVKVDPLYKVRMLLLMVAVFLGGIGVGSAFSF